MRAFCSLLWHECRSTFLSPATYTAAALFLLLNSFLFVKTVQGSMETSDIRPMEVFLRAFWLSSLFVVPLLTMKGIAEERRLGTLETLMTTPITAGGLVLAKFAASYLAYLTMWGATLSFPFLVEHALGGNPAVRPLLIEPGLLLGGYAFIALTGTLFVAVGIFASSLTRSQLVAGMLTFSILFIVIVGLPELREQALSRSLWIAEPLNILQVYRHLEDFSQGVVDTRPLLFYGSHAALVLGLATLVVESKT